MRIRIILSISFVLAILLPTFLYGIWSYRHTVRDGFDQAAQRHLLIAENLGYALERYHADLAAAVGSISSAMVTGASVPRHAELMKGLQISSVFIVDRTSSRVFSRVNSGLVDDRADLTESELQSARANAVLGETTFSPVIAGPNGDNEILIIHDFGWKLAIARLDTSYFVRLGGSVAFGKKGHAAIVDREGNLLAHPLPDWVTERKNISKISIVGRMMAGETGIEKFYSPALKGDMIAGFTSVPGPGWGIMVPQPVSELYEVAIWNNVSTFAVLAAGVTLAFLIIGLMMRSIVGPLEAMVRHLRQDAKSQELEPVPEQTGFFRIRELADFQQSYNTMIGAISEAQRKLRQSAYYDTVTGLPNRNRFHSLADKAIKKNLDEGGGGALIYVDLDDFKAINDLHGHDVGDEYLRHCAEKLVATANIHSLSSLGLPGQSPERVPLIARMGGDEFALLFPGLESDLHIHELLANLSREISLLSAEIGIGSSGSASIGCAVYPKDATTADELLKLADIAMYHAKKSGKNRSQKYDPAIGAQTTAEVRQAVQNAIRNDELALEYQPKVRATDWRPCGAEALVRWNHPERGRLAPDLWMPAIADSAVMNQLGEWVVGRAVRDRVTWASKNSELKLAINFDARQFSSPGFTDWLDSTLRKADIDNRQVVVEITEDMLHAADDRAERELSRLQSKGFAVSIDDFGKGYSNIARLAQMRVDQIKIDRSIVAGAMRDKRVEGILNAILDLARALGCETVAEGIETAEQAEFMSASGADILQGFYFSKSLSPEDLSQWLKCHSDGSRRDLVEPLKIAAGSTR